MARDIPGGPVVKIPMQRAWVSVLGQGIRSHMRELRPGAARLIFKKCTAHKRHSLYVDN